MAASSLSRFNDEVFSQRVFEPRESRLRKVFELFDRETLRGRLLDVAAGSGLVAEGLAGRGWQVSALDLSEELARQVRERGIADVRVHDLSAGPLPFEDRSFQAVFAGEIIEHLVDTAAFVRELARVLAPGGLAVITTPNLASFENRVRLLFGTYPAWMEYELSDQGHVRGYTKRTLRRQLAQHGLRVEKTRGNWVPFLPQRLMDDVRQPFLARTGDWLPGLSQGLIVSARRV
jgi:2-polyprenyl-3-methyl-5-hydroxy-6-metoxy-1,4-benzoquinol methylase